MRGTEINGSQEKSRSIWLAEMSSSESSGWLYSNRSVVEAHSTSGKLDQTRTLIHVYISKTDDLLEYAWSPLHPIKTTTVV